MCNKEIYEKIITQIECIMADVPSADTWKWMNRGYEELRILISNIPYMDIKKHFDSKKLNIRAEEMFHLAIAGCKDYKDELNRIVENSNDVDDVFTAALGLAALNEKNAYSTLNKLCGGQHRIKTDDVFDQLDCYIQHIKHPNALTLERIYIGNKSSYPRPENAYKA
ncbi:MAG TPA: hypothetical protein VL995_09310 [Cellvibrio sp.]|nr:hypothetical protein [Cellvibrio sp.]